jgi:hypothetical protein
MGKRPNRLTTSQWMSVWVNGSASRQNWTISAEATPLMGASARRVVEFHGSRDGRHHHAFSIARRRSTRAGAVSRRSGPDASRGDRLSGAPGVRQARDVATFAARQDRRLVLDQRRPFELTGATRRALRMTIEDVDHRLAPCGRSLGRERRGQAQWSASRFSKGFGLRARFSTLDVRKTVSRGLI